MIKIATYIGFVVAGRCDHGVAILTEVALIAAIIVFNALRLSPGKPLRASSMAV